MHRAFLFNLQDAPARLFAFMVLLCAVFEQSAAAQQMITKGPLATATLLDKFYEEIPKFVGLLLAASLGWFVSVGLAARWDIWKKQAETDVAIGRDFHNLIGQFRAIDREWGVLFERFAKCETAEAHSKAQEARYDLISRAIAAESSLESILLKLVTEIDERQEADHVDKRQRRLRTMSLLRLGCRRIREGVSEHRRPMMNYQNVEYWLFNRLASEVAQFVFIRATRKRVRVLAFGHAEGFCAPQFPAGDFLVMLSLRTFDWIGSVERLRPACEEYFRLRTEARDAARRANVARLFGADGTLLYGNQAGTEADATVVVLQARRGSDVTDYAADAFNRKGSIEYVIGLVPESEEALLLQRDRAPLTLRPNDAIPSDALVADVGSACLFELLTWKETNSMTEALGEIATTNLDRLHAGYPLRNKAGLLFVGQTPNSR